MANSTRFAIPLPDVGASADTWGTILNNAFSALEQKVTDKSAGDTITGNLSISGSVSSAMLSVTGAATLTGVGNKLNVSGTGSTFAASPVTAGTLNNVAIGQTTAAAGSFTTLASSGATALGALTATNINSTPIGATTRSTGAFTTLGSNSTTTLGATSATSINNTPIGATTASSGAFTTLSSSSTTSLGATSATSINNTPIGATTASTGSFTTLAYSNEGTTTATSAFQVPVGTTAQQPTGANGKIRYNTTTARYEGYSGAAWSSLGGAPASGPAFSACQSTTQSLDNNVATKINFQAKEFDTHNNYDNTTNFRFTPSVAGFYQINAQVAIIGGVSILIYKNGALSKIGQVNATNSSPVALIVSALISLNGSTDFVEIFARQNSGAPQSVGTNNPVQTYFQAFLARPA